MKFNIGDKVILVKSVNNNPHMIGSEGIVVDFGPNVIIVDFPSHSHAYIGGEFGGTTKWPCYEYQIKRIQEKYDGNTLTKWEDCPWQPNTIKEIA